MNKKNITRRKFLSTASMGTAVAIAAGGTGIYGNITKKASTLAILGGEPVRNKPFHSWPMTSESIEKSLISAFRSGKWCRIDGGAWVSTFEEKWAELMGTKRCVATGSGTQALHTALYSVGVSAGDEVLVTPCTFISSIQVIFLCDALPIFVDTDIDTFQLDANKMEPLINENTKAIEPVHISGYPAEMDKIIAIAKKHNLKVVEDACHAPLAVYKGKKCGTIGDLGCFSFQASKTIACGEGGAVVGNDDETMDRCYAFQNIGMPAKSKNSIIGPKYRMNELEASILIPQLETFEKQVNQRDENAKYLANKLQEIPGILPQKTYEGTESGGHYLFGFRYKKEHYNNVPRDKFLKALRAEGIPSTTMYFDRLNTQHFVEHTISSKTFQKIFSKERLKKYREQNQCPVNDQLSEEGVWFGQTILLGTKNDMDDIISAFQKLYENRDKLA